MIKDRSGSLFFSLWWKGPDRPVEKQILLIVSLISCLFLYFFLYYVPFVLLCTFQAPEIRSAGERVSLTITGPGLSFEVIPDSAFPAALT